MPGQNSGTASWARRRRDGLAATVPEFDFATSATLANRHFPGIVTNRGAGGVVTLTLPAPAVVKGKELSVACVVAQDIVLSSPGNFAVQGVLGSNTYTIKGVVGANSVIISDGQKYIVLGATVQPFVDSGNGGLLTPITSGYLALVGLAVSESRVISAPVVENQSLLVYVRSAVGPITCTVLGGFDIQGTSQFTMSAPGEFVSLLAVRSDVGGLQWRVQAASRAIILETPFTDPGTGGLLTPLITGFFPITARSIFETRAVAPPKYAGQNLFIFAQVVPVLGSIVVTVQGGADDNSDVGFTFTYSGQYFNLFAVNNNGVLQWRQVGGSDRFLVKFFAYPGNGSTLPASGSLLSSGVLPITTFGPEAITISNPSFEGQRLLVYGKQIAVGNMAGVCTVTVTNYFDVFPQLTFTIAAPGEFAELIGVQVAAGVYRWRLYAASQRILAARGFNRVPDRLSLNWCAGIKGKPGVVGDITNAAEATSAIADPEFMINGTNAASANSTFAAEGGIQLSTAGASADQIILMPHSLTSLSAWNSWNWGTEDQVDWEAYLKTGANITAATIWCGLKLTNTDTKATDADEVYFRYQDTVNGGRWECVISIGAVLLSIDTGVAVVVSTKYRFRISIDKDRLATFYLNDVPIFTTNALTTNVELIPVGPAVSAQAAAVKSVVTYGQSISRIAS